MVFIARNTTLIGAIELRPELRAEARTVIKALKDRHIETCIISGDHENPTRALAHDLNIDNYFAETLPEQKAEIIRNLQQQGKTVCYVGDGINDAIALKQTDVSVSLRGASTLAVDTAQILLMNTNLSQLLVLLDLAQRMDRSLKKLALIGAVPTTAIIGATFFLNFGLPFAITCYSAAMFTGLAHVFSPQLSHYLEHKKDRLTEDSPLT